VNDPLPRLRGVSDDRRSDQRAQRKNSIRLPNDQLVGDVFNPGGAAAGDGNDHLVGGEGDDIVTGDSFSPSGDASGGGNDRIVGGDGHDRMAGDSNTVDGTASGAATTTSWAARARTTW
jgi:Ca2+-binding RTX toxin-like protein